MGRGKNYHRRGTTALEMALFMNKPKEILGILLKAGSQVKKNHFQIVAADPERMKMLADHLGTTVANSLMELGSN